MSSPFDPKEKLVQRMYEVFKHRGGWKASAKKERFTLEEYAKVAALMHHHLEESHIFGMACRGTAWCSFVDALKAKFDTTDRRAGGLAGRIFRSVDTIAAYT